VLAATVLALTAATADPCVQPGRRLYVRAREHALYLCDGGKVKATHRVALGRGGVGKRREGDGRVPVGSYALGQPRPSARFHLFIPVGYPTPAQRAQGFSGGDIGVHGPHRLAQGAYSTLVDWTQGCIAVGTDDEIASIAAWVTEQKVDRILIDEL
jgi:murein L,D-transpeptidase YafK